MDPTGSPPTVPVQDGSMLALFIYDTSSLQDRLIQGAIVQKVSPAKSQEKTRERSEIAKL